jgi:hypothetical protein
MSELQAGGKFDGGAAVLVFDWWRNPEPPSPAPVLRNYTQISRQAAGHLVLVGNSAARNRLKSPMPLLLECLATPHDRRHCYVSANSGMPSRERPVIRKGHHPKSPITHVPPPPRCPNQARKGGLRRALRACPDPLSRAARRPQSAAQFVRGVLPDGLFGASGRTAARPHRERTAPHLRRQRAWVRRAHGTAPSGILGPGHGRHAPGVMPPC